MTLFTWSVTAASNNTADATINLREGMAPSLVNDASRAMMAAIAKKRNDDSGMTNTGGSSTAYTVTSSQGYTSLSDGISVTVRMHATNGATPTLNVDALGAKAIRVYTSTAVPTGAMLGGSIQRFTYDSGDDVWYVHAYRADLTPEIDSGTAMLFVQTAAPTGWTKDTTHNNKALRLVSGTAGTGGSTAFTSVFTSRTPAGTVGATTLTLSQIPPISLTIQQGVGDDNVSSNTPRRAATPIGANFTTSSVGSGGSHDHSFTGSAMNFDVHYVDVVVCIRD